MAITKITLNVDNCASSLDDFYDCIIQQERYHAFSKEYLAPFLRKKYGCEVEVNYVHGYCQGLEIEADSYDDEMSVQTSVAIASENFWDWVKSSGVEKIVTAIDWENETDGNYAADQIRMLLACGVDEEIAIEKVTQHILEDYEDYPQLGHAIEVM